MPLDYPIKFEPILQERIWGGEKLHKLFGKAKHNVPIGESWEISAIPNNISVVANGSLSGKNLQELLDTYKKDFVGEKVYERFGTKFPLLLKFIDAKSDLSVQLHPNDALGKKRHNSFGKEELWYILKAEKDSRLMFGFNQDLTRENYLKHLKDKTLFEVLHYEEIGKGDVYHIPQGRVHAIGAGVVLAEIQQSSDITYRLYDWDRKDTNGNARELHTDLALDAIDFNIPNKFRTYYKTEPNEYCPIVKSLNFKTNIIDLDCALHSDTKEKDSFKIYMCVAGSGRFSTKTDSIDIKTGETIFIPAVLDKYKIKPNRGAIRLLQIKI